MAKPVEPRRFPRVPFRRLPWPRLIACVALVSASFVVVGLTLEPALEALFPHWTTQQRLHYGVGKRTIMGVPSDVWDQPLQLSHDSGFPGIGYYSIGPDGVDQGGQGDDLQLGYLVNCESWVFLWAHWPYRWYRLAAVGPSLLWLLAVLQIAGTQRSADLRREAGVSAAIASLVLLAVAWYVYGTGRNEPNRWLSWDGKGLIAVVVFGLALHWRMLPASSAGSAPTRSAR